MLTARYSQNEGEVLRQVIDLSDWLSSGETIDTVGAHDVSTGLDVTDLSVLSPERTSYQFFAGAAIGGRVYAMSVEVETSDGQVRQDRFQFRVSKA